MTNDAKKESLIQLYKCTGLVQSAIEEKLDSLANDGVTDDFALMLCNLAEIAVQLIKWSYKKHD